MKIIAHPTQVIKWILLCSAVLLGACSTLPAPDQRSPSDTPSPAPRMTIVRSTTLEPSQTPGGYPTVTPHIFCDDTPESFLVLAERGRVTKTDDGETLNLRSGPGTNYRILEQIEQLEHFYVLGGPLCEEGYTWFEINYQGDVGWIAEGDDEQYYAEPFFTG